MSTKTEKYELFKYDKEADKNKTFNIETALNANWDKIDSALDGKLDKSAIPKQQGQTDKYLSTDGNSLVFKKVVIPSDFYNDGEILNEEKGYKQLLQLKHSTFDVSKFNVIGSPIISDDGIVSEFSSSKYLQLTNLPVSKLASGNSWKIKIKVIFNNINGQGTLFSSAIGGNTELSVALIHNLGKLGLYLGSDGEHWNISALSTSTNNFANNIPYLIESDFDGAKYTVNITNLTTGLQTTEITVNSSEKVYSGNNKIVLGGASYWSALNGQIDLKQFSIAVDGVEIFSGNETGIDTIKVDDETVEIPYTKTKTGSKIVDAIYRDRIAAVFEKYGNADYFVVDEENQNFSLPYGEIYGMKADKNEVEDKIAELSKQVRPIGQPIFRLDDTIFDDEVRLEGAAVSRTGYAKLFEIFGTTYGEGDGSTTFNLPDFRNRTLWGAENFGYVEAGLPDHTHNVTVKITGSNDDDGDPGNKYLTSPGGGNGTRTLSGTTNAASVANAIYGASETVQPPAVKVRVVARYK